MRVESQGQSGSVLGRVLSDDFLYVESEGRVTSKKHIVKLRFVELGQNSVCVLSNYGEGGRLPDWLQNIMSLKRSLAYEKSASGIVASKHIFGRITKASFLIDPASLSGITKRFYQKYGSSFERKEHEKYYGSSRPIILEYQEIERRSGLLEELEFDFQSAKYTSLIFGNKISRWQRDVTVAHLLSLFKPGQRILEVGCGTGIETLPLAKSGIKVVALDISSEMLSALSQRAKRAGLSQEIKTRKLSTSEIAEIKNDSSAFPREGFDGAFSDFGAPNLESNLRSFSKDIASLLKPRAVASFAVWNKFCMSEVPAKFVKREMGQVRQRFSGLVRSNEKSKYSLDTHTYTPREFASLFSDRFHLVSYFSLPTFIPPSEYSSRFSGLMRFRFADFALGRLPIFRDLGDNFVMTMRKTQ